MLKINYDPYVRNETSLVQFLYRRTKKRDSPLESLK